MEEKVNAMAKRGEKPEEQVKIAKERIRILFSEAEKEPEMAKRYMRMAKKIGMRFNVRLGSLKRKFCKKCYSYFTPENSQKRLKKGVLVVKCLECGNIQRYPYKSKKK